MEAMPRKWGQHFLVSQATQKRIADSCALTKDDEILEIGPGEGQITQHYVNQAKRVVLIEVDPQLAGWLTDYYKPMEHVTVIHADFRDIDPGSLGFCQDPVVLSDLPYYASKPILRSILEWGKYKRAILTFQKEVALRVVAKQGDDYYGALSLMTQLYAAGETLFNLDRKEFRPPPKVASTVIRITPIINSISVEERKQLEKFIKLCFSQSRKTLANNILHHMNDLTRAQVDTLLAGLNLKPMVRPHEIPLPIFQVLAKSLMRFPVTDDQKDENSDASEEDVL